MLERVQRMKERVVTSTFPLCVERLKIAFDVMERMKGKPILQIRSQIHADILDKMPIAIEADDIICGVGASKPNGIEMDYENGPWSIDEVEALKDEVYKIDPKDGNESFTPLWRGSRMEIWVSHNPKALEISWVTKGRGRL